MFLCLLSRLERMKQTHLLKFDFLGNPSPHKNKRDCDDGFYQTIKRSLEEKRNSAEKLQSENFFSDKSNALFFQTCFLKDNIGPTNSDTDASLSISKPDIQLKSVYSHTDDSLAKILKMFEKKGTEESSLKNWVNILVDAKPKFKRQVQRDNKQKVFKQPDFHERLEKNKKIAEERLGEKIDFKDLSKEEVQKMKRKLYLIKKKEKQKRLNKRKKELIKGKKKQQNIFQKKNSQKE